MGEHLNIDMGAVKAADRTRAWKELVCDLYFGLECRTGADDLRARIEGRWIDGASIAKSSLSPQTFVRTPSLIGRETDASVLFIFGAGGNLGVEHDGEASAVGTGDICLVDVSRRYSFSYASETGQTYLLHVPKSRIVQRVGAIDDVAFKPFLADDPLCRLAFNFVKGLASSAAELDAETASALLEQAIDLLSLPVARAKQGVVDPSTHRSATLLRVKSYVRAHLRDEGLTLGRAARVLGLSSRYINALFESEQTSFGRYVLTQRLEGAHRELVGLCRPDLQISDLAYGWGFANPSHFGRVFKSRYGVTPREARLGRAP